LPWLLFFPVLLYILASILFSANFEDITQEESKLEPTSTTDPNNNYPDVPVSKEDSFEQLSTELSLTENTSNKAFEEGKKLLLENRVADALKSFNEVVKRDDAPSDIYLYIGLSQLKLGRYSEAIDSFARGKTIDASNFHIYSFNMGNAFFAQNKFYDAEISYNEALSTGKVYSQAILNRANARMKIAKYHLALADYKTYLQTSPNDPQEEEVKLMIAALENAKMEEERSREALLQEAMRRVEQTMKEAEEAKAKKLLEEINSSLSSVENSDSISSGTEDTINYEEENDLD